MSAGTSMSGPTTAASASPEPIPKVATDLHVAGATAASALADQRLAGALMLYPGAIVFVVAAVLTISSSDSGR